MVDIIGSIKSAWNLAIHPSTVKPMSLAEALKFYYSFALIPAIVYAIIFAGISSAVPIFGAYAGASLGILILIMFFVAIPVSLFVDAALYHLFGKFIFRKFQSNYDATFTAVTVAVIPAVLFLWADFLTAGLIGIILGIWAIILLTLSLMKLQKVSGLIAVLSWLVPGIVITAVVVLLVLSFALGAVGPLGSAALSGPSSCIASSGFNCQIQSVTPSVSGATITLLVGQNTGTDLYNVTVALAPQQAGANSNGYPNTVVSVPIGTLTAGTTEATSFPVPSSYVYQNVFSGYLWMNYSTTPGGPSINAVKAATVIASVNST